MTFPRTRGVWRQPAPLALALLLAVLLAACGTRVDREVYFASQAGGPQAGGESPVSPGDAPGGGTSGEAPTGEAPGAVTTAAGTAGRPTPGTQGSGTAAGADQPAVSTEVVGDTIRIGMHVPITGAAPMPTDWMDTVRVLEEYQNANPIHGRGVQYIVEDDGYDPAKGLAACRKLADQNVFIVVGHTQPAVENACAGLFQSKGIPYFMRGTYEGVLDGRSLSWFATMGDGMQGRLMADYALSRLGGKTKKSAVVYENDQVAARDAFVQRITAGGGQVVVVEESAPRQPDFSGVIQKLQSEGAELVFLSQPPVNAIKIAVQSQGQGYHPTWLGGGTYWNYNMVLESAGMALDGAISFSPWASVDSPAAAEYRRVYQQYRPGKEAQDIGLVMWGWSEFLRDTFTKAGPQLSRAAIVSALRSYQFSSAVWTPITFTSTDHAGGRAVTVFRADGQAKRWRQITAFADQF